MKHDVPAALPLIAYAAGLACGHSYAEAFGFAAMALLLFGVRRVSAAFACIALAGGVFAAAHQRAVSRANDAALNALPADRFVTVEAPLDMLQSPALAASGVSRLTLLNPLNSTVTLYTQMGNSASR